jgi:hypothetical protein
MSQSNRPDVTINGVDYLVVPGDEGFRKDFIRMALQSQALPGQPGQFISRPDIRPMFQTSWAGGSRWEKPLVSDIVADSYFIADGFDVIGTPGDLTALPDTEAVASGSINANPEAIAQTPTAVYYFEAQKANLGLVKWDGTSFSTLTNDFGNANAGDVPVAACNDPVTSSIYAVFDDGGSGTSNVRYVTPDTAGGLVIALGGNQTAPGANIFMHNGRLMVWNGRRLLEITDPLGTPAVVTVFDDGTGWDYLSTMASPADSIIEREWGFTTGISTAEGVYLVKNVVQEGLPTPFIYRVDRDNAGTDIGTPIATLPPGTVVTNIFMHLGSLILCATSDHVKLLQNDISAYGHAQTTFFNLSNDSLGTIGQTLGPNPDETVHRFLGAIGPRLYVGGTKRIWVYDGVRGGLHPLIDDQVSATTGTWGSMVNTIASATDVLQFFHDDSAGLRLRWLADEGGNTITHTLESNYFDGNLPGELKSVVAVTLMTDGIKANETWTVSLSADDAAFASVATYDTDNDTTVKKEFVTAVEGYRFRYKLAYTASADVSAPSAIKGIIFWMVPGEVVTQWRMRLDLTESLNLQNQKQSVDSMQTSLETLGANLSLVSFVDHYRATDTTHDVRVHQVSLVKETADEGMVDVTLIEHNLDN